MAAINSARKLKREIKEFLKSVLVQYISWLEINRQLKKFEEVMNHIHCLGDTDIIKHSQVMAKNATYLCPNLPSMV